eukprot:TRINITY_DN14127_c0_g1_i2.p1 TRINITY_DN14127_c0_g1~~TRINITY_DN14127_c0_g1_i2.p1  ORF type:complete len:677 (-),score=108.19 TRINITY_DN14127_c0_g1_i2:126-2156(-)
MQRVTITTTADNHEGWLLEVDVEQGATVAMLKRILAASPHNLGVTAATKVLFRDKGVLTTMFDKEQVKSHVTLLNVTDDQVVTFPENFLWGSATASYQVEGSVSRDGRSPSIWDTFSAIPGRTHKGDSGREACDHYRRFREDVQLMKNIGLRAYRFSISWSRLLPKGRGEINNLAVAFYDDLLTELLTAGITPMATLYHWDLPQCLEDEYGGWLDRRIVDDFREFAQACFQSFGDKVKYWVTLNEPWCSAVMGYCSGEHAPGRSHAAGREPYLAAHHLLLAHAHAVKCYREGFQQEQQGSIGIVLNMDWKEPLTPSADDTGAQQRALDWQLGWFADPIYKGRYPETMRKRCQDRLPTFTPMEIEILKGSADFFGLNHYSSDFVSNQQDSSSETDHSNYFADQQVENKSDPRWPRTDMGWDIVPWGFERLLSWIQKEYAPPGGIIVTENGCAVREDTATDALNDKSRIEYLQGYIFQLHRALSKGADVRGYFVWSFLDNFEWAFGYSKRFGIVRVDFESQQRTPKASAGVLSTLAKDNKLRLPSAVSRTSEFLPFKGLQIDANKEGYPGAHAKLAKPQLSKAEAKQMLQEFCERYDADKFQNKMVRCFEQYMIHNDEMMLLKARRALCMPIQAEILPKYGFEPTARGVAQVQRVLTAPAMMEEAEIKDLQTPRKSRI